MAPILASVKAGDKIRKLVVRDYLAISVERVSRITVTLI